MRLSNFPVTIDMWRVIFFERAGPRVVVDRSGPWQVSKNAANDWAAWFENRGYCVALQSQQGLVERRFAGLPP
jgi:hypothetical protein